jgi:sugar lactone lactonase YvrE
MDLARVSCVLGAAIVVGGVSSATAAGLPVQFRGAATAPAGAAVVGAQTWICDASQGFAPFPLTPGAGIHLPISPTTVPATCGEIAADGNGNIYVTQGVVDTSVTPAPARGILRATLDPQTGALIGSPVYIATTVGLGGDQPTGAAIGPDGNLYIAFLKNGNIKRIVNPASGTTQVVQSVGGTPNGHPGRSLAFVGNDLYIGSVDAFSVIHGATNASCQGGCNAAPIADGFSGVPHDGVTSNGVDTVYFAVGTYNQVWRYTPATGLFSFIASNFSFVPAKSNLLTLDETGTLWVGDDPSGGTAVGAGRVWTVSPADLATVTGGNFTAGTNLQLLLNALRGPWLTLIGNTSFVPTFNTDGTFTATIQLPDGTITTDSGIWTLTPPVTLAPFGNPQGQLTLIDSQGAVLLSGEALLANVDLIALEPAVSSLSNAPSIAILQLVKFAA